MSMVEEVNESRKRQKDSLSADINRKKKQLDDIATKRGKTEDILLNMPNWRQRLGQLTNHVNFPCSAFYKMKSN